MRPKKVPKLDILLSLREYLPGGSGPLQLILCCHSPNVWNNSLHWWGEEELQRATTEAGTADTADTFVIIPSGPSKPGWQDLTRTLSPLCAVITAAYSLQDTLTPVGFHIPCCGKRFMPPHCFTNSWRRWLSKLSSGGSKTSTPSACSAASGNSRVGAHPARAGLVGMGLQRTVSIPSDH